MAKSFQEQLTERFGPAAEQDGGPAGGDIGDSAFLHRVLTRRTHRRYADRPVEPALTDLLCAAALSASSKSDFQQASIVRVADPARRAALAALVPSMPWIGAAPLFLVFCGDARRLERIGELRGHPQENGKLEGFFNAAVDAALVMQTFILTAESVGLGCCPISVLRNKVDAVGEILSLPEKVFPVAGLCVGWPAGEGHVSMRLPPAVTVHVDRYDDSGLPAQIERYDRMRDARHSIPPDQQRAPERFGTADFYGWSEDKARQAAMPEGAAFPPWLRRQGFSFD